MERTLYLLRHAKSSWDDPSLDDQRRPLSGRGRRATRVISDYLREGNVEPQLVLCSPARRTLETYEQVRPAGELQVELALYAATAKDLLDRLRHLSDDLRSVMLIGHNPALQLLILKLAARHGGAAAEAVERKFPTGALATVRITGSWQELGSRSATLTGVVRPKDLQPTSD